MAILTIALGTGANTAVYSVVHAVLLRPLPYGQPDRLVMVWEKVPARNKDRFPVSVPNFSDWRAENTVFQGMVAFYRWDFNLTDGGDPERLSVGLVTAGLAEVLEVDPILGRDILPEEDRPGGELVVVLSQGLWQRRYGADPGILSRQLTLDGKSYKVIGVMPDELDLPEKVEMWVPLAEDPAENSRLFSYLNAVARLRPGLGLEEARTEMDLIARRLEQEYPETNAGRGVTIVPLHEQIVGDVSTALYILFGAVALTLALACANVANLVLARTSARRSEIAVRAALGASRRQLTRQLLVESLLLALLGGTAGLLFASGGVSVLGDLEFKKIPRLDEVAIDATVLGFTLLTTLLAGLAFGLVPALRFSKADLSAALRSGNRNASGGVRRWIVVLEVAAALTLVIGAVLLMKSFLRLQAVDPGFDPAGLVTLQIELPAAKYPEEHQPGVFYTRLFERISALPGIDSVGGSFAIPFCGWKPSTGFTIVGRPESDDDNSLNAMFNPVNPDYFRALDIPLLQGRSFTGSDNSDGRPVVVISEEIARRYFPDGDVLGKQITFSANFGTTGVIDEEPREIVGVVGEIKHSGLDKPVVPALYVPYSQASWRTMSLVLRTSLKPISLVPVVRGEIWALDGDLALSKVKTMEGMISDSVGQPRLYSTLLAIFAALAFVLAMVGIYGVISDSVGQRRREIGIRMALGARQRDVLKQVIGQGMLLVTFGMASGLIAAYALTRVLASLLFDVVPADLTSFGVGSLGLAVVGLLATYLPARHASRIEPLKVLRHD
jgi:putative ABC transport system permease protein